MVKCAVYHSSMRLSQVRDWSSGQGWGWGAAALPVCIQGLEWCSGTTVVCFCITGIIVLANFDVSIPTRVEKLTLSNVRQALPNIPPRAIFNESGLAASFAGGRANLTFYLTQNIPESLEHLAFCKSGWNVSGNTLKQSKDWRLILKASFWRRSRKLGRKNGEVMDLNENRSKYVKYAE